MELEATAMFDFLDLSKLEWNRVSDNNFEAIVFIDGLEYKLTSSIRSLPTGHEIIELEYVDIVNEIMQ